MGKDFILSVEGWCQPRPGQGPHQAPRLPQEDDEIFVKHRHSEVK